jgi:hypothetical protein
MVDLVCGNHGETLEWDAEQKAEVCSICRSPIYGESAIKKMLDAAGMTPQDFLAACEEDRAMFDAELVTEVLQRFKLGSPPLNSPVRRLAEHVVRLEAHLTRIIPNLKIGVTTVGQEVVMVPPQDKPCYENKCKLCGQTFEGASKRACVCPHCLQHTKARGG